MSIADISEIFTPSALTVRFVRVKAPRGVPTKYGERWVLEAVMQDRAGATIGVGQWAEDEATTKRIQEQWKIGQLVELKEYKGGKDAWQSTCSIVTWQAPSMHTASTDTQSSCKLLLISGPTPFFQ